MCYYISVVAIMKGSKMKTFKIQDREAGNVIEKGLTEEEAKKLLAKYEEDDKKEGIFEENFYEIAEDD